MLRRILIGTLIVSCLVPIGDTRGAVIQSDKLWAPGSVVTVCFFGGSNELRMRIASVALEWTQHGNVKLDFGDLKQPRQCLPEERNDIRVGFSGSGYWSFVGIDSRSSVPQTDASMNLQSFDAYSPQDLVFRNLVLHQFGHALGFQHEHQSPEAPCEEAMNWEALYKDMSEPPNKWDRATIDRNFRRYEAIGLIASDFDPKSVMMYSLPALWFKQGDLSACAVNTAASDLSATDQAAMAAAYPSDGERAPEIVARLTPPLRQDLLRSRVLRPTDILQVWGWPLSEARGGSLSDLSREQFARLYRGVLEGEEDSAGSELQGVADAVSSGDYPGALYRLQDFANSESSFTGAAALKLAAMYFHGLGTPVNESTAMRWTRAAAERNEPRGQTLLGLYYLIGYQVVADPNIAAEWLRKAADQKEAEGAYFYGLMLANGVDTVSQDLQQAFEVIRFAAERGVAAAETALGIMYDQGLVVAADPVKAFNLYSTASSRGYTQAKFLAGLMLIDGRGVEADAIEGVRRLTEAAESGLAVAQASLAYLYKSGTHVEASPAAAFTWFRKAAVMGHVAAQFEVGNALEGGIGVKADLKEALDWHEKAAKSFFPAAQLAAGILLSKSDPPLRDLVRADAWLTLATRQKDDRNTQDEAVKILQELEGWLDDLDWAKAKKLAADTVLTRPIGGSLTATPPPAGAETLPAGLAPLTPTPDLVLISTGTGVVISRQGAVLTNFHVVEKCDAVRALWGNEWVDMKPGPTHPEHDLAVYWLSNFQPGAAMKFRDRPLRRPDKVVALGFPLPKQTDVTTVSAMPGFVSGLTGSGPNTNHIQITAEVTFGNSGGPVVDESGRIGAIVVQQQNIYLTPEDEEIRNEAMRIREAVKLELVTSFLSGYDDIKFETEPKSGVVDIEELAKNLVLLLNCFGSPTTRIAQIRS